MSRIVKTPRIAVCITTDAIPLIALVLALCLGCAQRSSQGESGSSAAAKSERQTGSAEHQLPHPQSYAHHLDDPGREEWQKPDEVVELLECQPGMRVVDLGAGTGYFIGYLSEAVGPEGRVLALDTDRSMVDAMYEKIERDELRNVKPDMVLPDDPALTPRSVDRILVVNTWHHIRDRVSYGEKLREALGPGGLLLIIDFTMESPHGPPPQMRLTGDTVLGELQAAGFVPERLEESLPYQYAIAGRLP